ncbi:hypothetical protein Hanom_Chr00s000001g01592221 [Helianthus anomalus]
MVWCSGKKQASTKVEMEIDGGVGWMEVEIDGDELSTPMEPKVFSRIWKTALIALLPPLSHFAFQFLLDAF